MDTPIILAVASNNLPIGKRRQVTIYGRNFTKDCKIMIYESDSALIKAWVINKNRVDVWVDVLKAQHLVFEIFNPECEYDGDAFTQNIYFREQEFENPTVKSRIKKLLSRLFMILFIILLVGVFSILAVHPVKVVQYSPTELPAGAITKVTVVVNRPMDLQGQDGFVLPEGLRLILVEPQGSNNYLISLQTNSEIAGQKRTIGFLNSPAKLVFNILPGGD